MIKVDSCKKLLITLIFATISIFLTTNNVYGQHIQSESKENSFRVIITLFDVNQNTGDIILFVSSENITKWKIFTPFNELRSGNTAEVSFTINGSNVNPEDIFKSCVLITKEVSIICINGENSVAERPEIVDINLSSAQAIKVNVQDEKNLQSSVLKTVEPEKTQISPQDDDDNEQEPPDGQDNDDQGEDEQTETEIVEVKPTL